MEMQAEAVYKTEHSAVRKLRPRKRVGKKRVFHYRENLLFKQLLNCLPDQYHLIRNGDITGKRQFGLRHVLSLTSHTVLFQLPNSRAAHLLI